VKADQFSQLLTIVEEGHGPFGFDLRPGNIFIFLDEHPRILFTLGFVGGAEIFSKHPDRAKVLWDRDASPELQPHRAPRGRQKNEVTLPIPAKASYVYGLANVLKFFWGDIPELRELLLSPLKPFPDARDSDRFQMNPPREFAPPPLPSVQTRVQ
jgi:hypothetical protein